MNAKPRNEWILIRRLVEGESKTEAGIVLLESQARSTRGTVEGFGSKVKGIKVGDQVIFTNFPIDIELGDKELALVRDEEVYAVIEA